ncbi:MAG: hypothetical protein JNJ52_08010 [Flavobacterium sp.]|nr:hypothetical protein [Flavobacterium sp.]
MDNQDTLLNQIKSAAQNAESKEFPAMDKVWNRVEDKLDHKVLTKQNTLWKKIAVAASILLVVSIGYQFLKEEEKIIITPQNTTATIIDTTTTVLDSTENKNTIAVVAEKNQNIKADAEKVLEKQINEAPTVAANEVVIPESDAKVMQVPAIVDPRTYNMASVVTNNGWTAERNFQSRGVTYKDAKIEDKEAPKPIQTIKKKEDPLIVVDDKKADLSVVKDANEEDFESIVHLPNPLYIINGVYYTEQEVFGPNPTSPYSPLNKQEIETISILQDEKAISIYGEKGKNGVVIITTKNGKPTPKKKE